VGVIGKPHGIAGDVYVERISDDPSRFEPGAQLSHEDGRRLVVERSRVHRSRFLVKFEGSEDRSSAEGLRGSLFIEAAAARPLGPDEFWPDDLVGCVAYLPDGAPVGEVTELIAGVAQDLLSVRTTAGSRLVPLVKEIVVDVDVESKRITLDPPAGLLD
jgi:16S rRNA processing protein RimM